LKSVQLREEVYVFARFEGPIASNFISKSQSPVGRSQTGSAIIGSMKEKLFFKG